VTQLLGGRGRGALRRLALALLAAGAALVFGAPAAWLATRPPEAAGSLAALAAEPHGAADAVAERLARPEVRSLPRAAAPQPATRSARLASHRAIHVRPPVRVRVPALGLQAKVVPVGVEASGELELPRTGRVAGWYRFGSEPGRPGTAVLAAHVDYAARPGVFYHLRTLEPGARVSVRLAGGSMRHFRVIARRSYGKQELPRRLFARAGKPALALVTCGGAFDEATRTYAENVVVWAVPVV